MRVCVCVFEICILLRVIGSNYYCTHYPPVLTPALGDCPSTALDPPPPSSIPPPPPPTSGIITLWSLETVTLLSTLLPPRTRDLPFPWKSSSSQLKCLGFIAGSGRILAAGDGYAAVWDMVSPEVREASNVLVEAPS